MDSGIFILFFGLESICLFIPSNCSSFGHCGLFQFSICILLRCSHLSFCFLLLSFTSFFSASVSSSQSYLDQLLFSLLPFNEVILYIFATQIHLSKSTFHSRIPNNLVGFLKLTVLFRAILGL